MNRLELVRRLKRESARSGPVILTTTSLSADDQRLSDWVDDAYLEIQRREHGWTFMRRELVGVTVMGQRGYTADELNVEVTDFGRWLPPATEGYRLSVEQSTGQAWFPRWVPWEKFRADFELRETQTGPPAYWSISPDDKLYIGPTPAVEYTVRAIYYRAPVAFVADEDTPAWAPEYHMILVWRALMELANFDSAPEVYARGAMNFENLETDMMRRYGPKISFAHNRL